jgi:hypothetical protein
VFDFFGPFIAHDTFPCQRQRFSQCLCQVVEAPSTSEKKGGYGAVVKDFTADSGWRFGYDR